MTSRPGKELSMSRRALIASSLVALALTGCSCESTPGATVDAALPDGARADTSVAPDDGSTPREDGNVPQSRACKRGIAYGHHSVADLTALQPAVSWWYNWYYQPDEALRAGGYRDLGVEYVPMVWGRDFDSTAIIRDIPAGATTLLGFNEPNFGSQADISAADAAAMWPEVERIADERGGLLLVSPAVNYCGGDCQDTDPFHYLEEFFAACTDCRVDRVAFHIYVGCHPDGDDQARWLIDHVRQYESRFSQPLWLTEFACTDAASYDEQIAFLEDAVAFLESDPRIERYAWFSGRFEGIPFVDLLGEDGELTPLGQAYVDAPASTDCDD